jgi:uncharacterized membrane protein YraQ (UPF0718 family)
MSNAKKLSLIILTFLGAYFIPFQNAVVAGAVTEALLMLQEYARQHVLTCLVPAFFIAGAIAVFISQAAVIKYFGAEAKKVVAYGVASVSGTILAVCSCTVLPMFAGIYTRGAGIGPAVTFLYSGPAINVLAIILTARILGFELGLARAVGAIIFSIFIGLSMAAIYHKEDRERVKQAGSLVSLDETSSRSLGLTAFYFFVMIMILITATWGKPAEPVGFWNAVYGIHWWLAAGFLILLGIILLRWFEKPELKTWVDETWTLAQQIFPLLFAGVLVAGLLLGRPGTGAGLIPSGWIEKAVGGNSLQANFFASISGALMYFATLTEIPILQGLIGSGMGKGPALALLLSGPAVSLPSMLVIRSVIGTKKTLVYVGLIIIFSTLGGFIYGTF